MSAQNLQSPAHVWCEMEPDTASDLVGGAPRRLRIAQVCSAPEGPSRVARDFSPWFAARIDGKPQRGDVELCFGRLMAPSPRRRADRRFYSGEAHGGLFHAR